MRSHNISTVHEDREGTERQGDTRKNTPSKIGAVLLQELEISACLAYLSNSRVLCLKVVYNSIVLIEHSDCTVHYDMTTESVKVSHVAL